MTMVIEKIGPSAYKNLEEQDKIDKMKNEKKPVE